MTMEVPDRRIETHAEDPLRIERGERVIALVSLHHCPGACLAGTPAIPWHRSDPKRRPALEGGRIVEGCPEWIGIAATVAAPLLAITALIVSIRASRRVAPSREIELLLARFDLKAAKREIAYLEQRLEREKAIRDTLDRSY